MMCIYAMKEVVQHFLGGRGNVYASFLDASKGFDRVWFDALISVLIRKCIVTGPATFIAAKCHATWKDSTADYFMVSNGISYIL